MFSQLRGINGTTGHQWTSPNQTHDIFEGTEQIQLLVISRAISGLRIEWSDPRFCDFRSQRSLKGRFRCERGRVS